MLVLIILLALAFDYINGFHDTANAIATTVSTRAITPGAAVVLAALLNVAGALSGTAVAETIGGKLVNPELVTKSTVIAALLGAISWNLATWWLGIPSSSSHALIGGIVGAVAVSNGLDVLNWPGLAQVVSGLIVSPVLGFAAGLTVMLTLFRLLRKSTPGRINQGFRRLQVVSACLMAFAHGSNDAQKSMGIITMTLVGTGYLKEMEVPFWVILACAAAMGLGTLAGGWRIIRTLGSRIFRLEPVNGFAADLASSLVIYSASALGLPVSTTHVVSSSILGVGTAKRPKGVKWGVAAEIITAWFVTIPASGTAAALICKVMA